MVFDGDCTFCRRWIERWRGTTGDAVEYRAYQEIEGNRLGLTDDDFAEAVHLIEPDGSVTRGAEAVFRALAVSGHPVARWAYDTLPGVSSITETIYRVVARHRHGFSRLTSALWGAELGRPQYGVTASVFVRALAAIYLVAFVSLWVQVQGLMGSDGIVPLAPALERIEAATGGERYWVVPSLFWIAAGDGFIHLLCGVGVVVSLLVVLGVVPALGLAVLWIVYLSFCTVGYPFLNFQWDALLLEAGFLAIFVAPLTWRQRAAPLALGSRVAMWLERWLLFRLMFLSGVVKLTSGDAAWGDLTALDFHYETQPIPTWTSWYAHHLPGWFQSVSMVIMFVVEIGIPFLILAPRRLRYAAFVLLVALQILIMATGNYGFFNLLAVVLCLLLLDDTVWPARWRRAIAERAPARAWPAWVVVPLAVATVTITFGILLRTVGLESRWMKPVDQVSAWVSPLRSFNSYGLFRVMTTSRPEIVIEGSNDGQAWVPYEFKWKPGDRSRRPRFATPHMPRLDWQMWFAALGTPEHNRWFSNFLLRLRDGSDTVFALLEDDPFPDGPPRYIRAVLFDYRFTSPAERGSGEGWWRREVLRLYHPVLAQPDSPPLTAMPRPVE